MSSANEHLTSHPPKPRMSPLDFRNTDLVSRLLAATPPYLYNMSLLPNTYFFSEMLRSLVQAKTEHNNRTNAAAAQVHHPRRSRKRTWSSTRAECFQKQALPIKSPEKSEAPPPNEWLKNHALLERKAEEPPNHPIELTINKIENPDDSKLLAMNYQNLQKPETSMSEQMYPMLPPNMNQESSSNLVLPPPPPMWYPPLYPAPPYGIDPLHFFIDLRVSGHIYDKKNQQKDVVAAPNCSMSSPPVSEETPEVRAAEPVIQPPKDFFRQSRHASAFSVPVPSAKNSKPINLSEKNESRTANTKFDVKSMGFDKSDNKTSTNYIIGNIKNIYRNIDYDAKDLEKSSPSSYSLHDESALPEETEEERQKRVKDLRALIGLELVVDYMNHAKPGQPANHPSIESVSSNDRESISSPPLKVVDLHDES